MRIYLIGFMGTGKSTLGQKVANASGVQFIDTDLEIESQEKSTVAGIFDTLGEKEFRAIEAEMIRQTIIYEKALIATGGGLPCFYENMEWMNEHGITMYLSWPLPLLKKHLATLSPGRPLLQNLLIEEVEEKIEMLFAERMPYYEMAAMTIDMSGNIERDFLVLKKACNYIW